jgi:SAM-dependent methyltransferase
MRSNQYRKFVFLWSMGVPYWIYRFRLATGKPVRVMQRHLSLFSGNGLEFGGASAVFQGDGLFPAYKVARRVDNVTFSTSTLWEGQLKAGNNFVFDAAKPPGEQFILEREGLLRLPDASYDFILSSHMLEHTANPLGLLQHWKRLLKPSGHLMLILPHRDGSFDHQRPVTTLSHLVEDFNLNQSEEDGTHLDEILELHDLARDPTQSSHVTLRAWIGANAQNRGAHHHVFDLRLSVQMLTEAGFQMVDMQAVMPMHIVLLARRPADALPVDSKPFLPGQSNSYRQSPFKSDKSLSH